MPETVFDNLIGQNVIMWGVGGWGGVLMDGINWLIEIRTAQMYQLFASCCAMQI